MEEKTLFVSQSPGPYLNSFHSSFAEVLLHLHIDLHVASIATNREQNQHLCNIQYIQVTFL